MRRLFAMTIGTTGALLFAAAVQSANPPAAAASIQRGHDVFQHTCAPCHGFGNGDDGRKMLPAPTALTLKYHGSISPYLEERSDLPYETLRVFVRRGSWSMPGFRKTEVTETDIKDIAAYLADSAKTLAKKGTK